jgi:hypothetical protein
VFVRTTGRAGRSVRSRIADQRDWNRADGDLKGVEARIVKLNLDVVGLRLPPRIASVLMRH